MQDDIQNVFFEAMIDAYTTDDNKFPRSRVTPFIKGDFKVQDIYLAVPFSQNSNVTTTISYKDTPVWIMYYGGLYSPYAITFLIECLLLAYKEHSFYGGRGAHLITGNNGFIYENKIDQNDFSRFFGQERVLSNNHTLLGYHWYRGMSLISDKK